MNRGATYGLHMSEKLREFLATGKDWAKVKTTIPSVFIQKLPVDRVDLYSEAGGLAAVGWELLYEDAGNCGLDLRPVFSRCEELLKLLGHVYAMRGASIQA